MIIFHRKIHVKMALLSIAKLLQLSEGRQTGSFIQMKLEKQGSNTFFSFFSLILILFHTRPWKALTAWWPSQCLLSHLANVTGAAWEAQDCLRMKSTSLSSPNTNAQPLLPHFRHLEKVRTSLLLCGTNGTYLTTEFFLIQLRHSLASTLNPGLQAATHFYS